MLTLYFPAYYPSRGLFNYTPWFHQPSGLRSAVDRDECATLHRIRPRDRFDDGSPLVFGEPEPLPVASWLEALAL